MDADVMQVAMRINGEEHPTATAMLSINRDDTGTWVFHDKTLDIHIEVDGKIMAVPSNTWVRIWP